MLEWKWKYEEGTCQIAVRDLAGKEHTVSITFEEGKEPKVSDGNTDIEIKKRTGQGLSIYDRLYFL